MEPPVGRVGETWSGEKVLCKRSFLMCEIDMRDRCRLGWTVSIDLNYIENFNHPHVDSGNSTLVFSRHKPNVGRLILIFGALTLRFHSQIPHEVNFYGFSTFPQAATTRKSLNILWSIEYASFAQLLQ